MKPTPEKPWLSEAVKEAAEAADKLGLPADKRHHWMVGYLDSLCYMLECRLERLDKPKPEDPKP